MNITNEKGLWFSLDLIIALITILLIITIMLNRINTSTETLTEEINKIELQRNTIFIIDSLTKNRNLENPLLGSATLNEEKKRVMQNSLDPKLIKQAKPIETDKFFTAKLAIKTNEERIIFQKKQKGNCITLDRTITISNRTGKVEVTACEKRILP